MRAYHRVDPLMDERKSHYSPAEFGAFMKVQLVAGRQSTPGQFRSLQALRDALPKAYARHVDFLVTERDLLVRKSGVVVVDGWKEWQEGDLTVAERMKRLRERKKADAEDAEASPEPSPERNADRNDERNGVTDDNPETLRTPASLPAIGVGSSVGSSVGLEKAPSATAVAKPRASDPRNEPRLTEAQLKSWESFGPAWDRFKEAWLSRGLLFAPFGSPDGDDTSQRGLLFQIMDARPTDIVRWVREAPTPNSREVITYILERWHDIREEVGVDDEEWEAEKIEERRSAGPAMTRITDIVTKLQEKKAEDAA